MIDNKLHIRAGVNGRKFAHLYRAAEAGAAKNTHDHK